MTSIRSAEPAESRHLPDVIGVQKFAGRVRQLALTRPATASRAVPILPSANLGLVPNSGLLARKPENFQAQVATSFLRYLEIVKSDGPTGAYRLCGLLVLVRP